MLIIACTGFGREVDRRKARAAGFDAHLTKPIHPIELESLLRRLTTRH